MRRALDLSILAITGAAITVTIAWTNPFSDWSWNPQEATNPHVYRDVRFASSVYIRQYMYMPPADPTPTLPADPQAFAQTLEAGPFQEAFMGCRLPAFGVEFADWAAEYRGFPLRCFWGWRYSGYFTNATSVRSSFIALPNLNPIAPPGEPGPRVPATPIWTGLLINTIFWAGAIHAARAFLIFIPTRTRAAVRAARLRRGQCEHCAYDLTSAASPCPECGLPPTQK